jgi:hypothetical protein
MLRSFAALRYLSISPADGGRLSRCRAEVIVLPEDGTDFGIRFLDGIGLSDSALCN